MPEAREHLIVMTRLPRAGRTKTRLIPELGPAGAAAFHDALARHAIGRASSLALTRPGARLTVRVEGGSSTSAREWLGGTCDCRRQHDGDLGERIHHAVREAFDEGSRKVVVIGTDCPSLDEATLEAAFDALERASVVIAPAHDGGYVLIGLTAPDCVLFEDIDWGGPEVFAQTLAAARRQGVAVEVLDRRADVDTPDDLPAARAELTAGSTVSVIIPTLNEAETLPSLLERLRDSGAREVLIADGGSRDATVEVARRSGATVIESARGRGVQMNAAASAARGEFLLFLHADTWPPEEFPALVAATLRAPGVAAGAFGFSLSDDYPPAALIEAMVDLRCRFWQLPYGDQGFFLRRRVFHHLGDFPEWPAMEDYAMARRAKKLGTVVTTRARARTSSRRWRQRGLVRTFIRHQLMIAAHWLGAPSAWLVRLRP